MLHDGALAIDARRPARRVEAMAPHVVELGAHRLELYQAPLERRHGRGRLELLAAALAAHRLELEHQRLERRGKIGFRVRHGLAPARAARAPARRRVRCLVILRCSDWPAVAAPVAPAAPAPASARPPSRQSLPAWATESFALA